LAQPGLQTIGRVVFPMLLPAILTGAAMAFARGAGEYGSIIFIAGNIPAVSEIAPLLIVTKLEQYDYAGAAAIGVVMLAASFVNAAGPEWPAKLGGETQMRIFKWSLPARTYTLGEIPQTHRGSDLAQGAAGRPGDRGS